MLQKDNKSTLDSTDEFDVQAQKENVLRFETKNFTIMEKNGSLLIDDKRNDTKGVVVSVDRAGDINVSAKKLNQFRLIGTDTVKIAH